MDGRFTLDSMVRRAAGNSSAWVSETDWQGAERRLSFKEVVSAARSLAEDLRESGLVFQEVIGLKSKNCIDWLVWDIAAIISGAVLQVFPEEDPTPSSDLMKRNGLRFLATDGEEHGHGCDRCSTKHRLGIRSRDGKPAQEVLTDLHSKTYSSGTEGSLKGLLVSKRGTETLVDEYIRSFGITSADSTVLFLPLSHYPQRLTAYAALWAGASIHLTDVEDALKLSCRSAPTFLSGQASFFDHALHEPCGNPGGVADPILGGNLRFILTAMATPEMTADYVNAGVSVYEAYGVTELGMVAWNCPSASRPGTVGKPIAEDEVVLAADGEILVKRANPLCIGYFVGNEQYDMFGTGPYTTGDIGSIDAEGFLRVIGRKKNLVTTRTGESHHLEELEQIASVVSGIEFFGLVYDRDQHEFLGYLVASRDLAEGAAELVRQQIEARMRAAIGRWTVIRIVRGMTVPSAKNGLLTRSLKLDRTALLDVVSGVAIG